MAKKRANGEGSIRKRKDGRWEGRYEDVTTVLHRLLEAAEGATVKKRFLLICLQYDGIGRQLPDPIWWISGNPELTEAFADGFLQNLKRLCECG